MRNKNDYQLIADFERDHDSDIWEWHDMPVSLENQTMLRDMASSKEVKIRYVGNQYHDDRSLTSKEKNIIKTTLDIYEEL